MVNFVLCLYILKFKKLTYFTEVFRLLAQAGKGICRDFVIIQISVY